MHEEDSAPTTIAEAIAENAKGPLKGTSDGASFEQHPLPDQIAADKYAASKAAMSTPMGGMVFGRLVAPGAV